jgi:uncharacterized protein YdcH (DUF465 family)
MPMREQLKAELIETDADFRSLHDQHQALEHELESLAQKVLLSEEVELEEKRIKREKLRLKDQMEMLLRDRLAALAPATG